MVHWRIGMVEEKIGMVEDWNVGIVE